MSYINGIYEISNPFIIIAPVIMMSLSGYTVGRGLSLMHSTKSSLLKDFCYGNIILNFIFISGFILTGLLSSLVVEYFTSFTIAIIILTIIAGCLLIKVNIHHFRNAKSLLRTSNLHFGLDSTIFLGGVLLFVSIIVFYAFIIYYHSIFTEYDSLYLFLLVSKSILLGNSINVDYYTGSDMVMKFPPFAQVLNAWIMHSFGYSAVRFFPLYFVFFASLSVYGLTKNVAKEPFFALISMLAFLVLPAMLVTSSLYSLQQDILFIFFFTSSALIFSDMVRKSNDKLKLHLFLMAICLSLLSLSREIGLLIAIAFIFLIPAFKFTKGRLVLRILLSIIAFSPFYILSIYNLIQVGFAATPVFEILSLVLINSAIIYVLFHARDQYEFKWFVKTHFKYLLVFIVPLIFITSNIVSFQGPYPVFTFSSQLNSLFTNYRQIMGFEDHLQSTVTQAFWAVIPRIDILFISTAMGGIFVFIKIRGLGRLIYNLKNDPQCQIIMIFLLLLLINWSFLLGSRFEGASIRHITYFAPLISVLLVLGLVKKEKYFKLIYLSLIVFSLYYFISQNLFINIYEDKFGGFRLDPEKEALVTFNDLRVAGAIFAILLALETFGNQIGSAIKGFVNKRRWHSQMGVTVTSAGVIGVLLVIQIYLLASYDIPLTSHEKLDQIPPAKWEQNVFEVIDYLRTAEDGNVLSVRAPAIPFFTNRTTYDVYSPHAFASTIHPFLRADSIEELENVINTNRIGHVVVPKQGESQIFHIAENLRNNSQLIDLIESDQNFEKISFDFYDIYKHLNGSSLNMIDNHTKWVPFSNTQINQDDELTVNVQSQTFTPTHNRAVLKTNIDMQPNPLLLSLEYRSMSFEGLASYYAEIRDANGRILWGGPLNQTSGNDVKESFVLPGDLIAGNDIELRFYIITQSPGSHLLVVKKAIITYT